MVRLWSPPESSLLWETSLGAEGGEAVAEDPSEGFSEGGRGAVAAAAGATEGSMSVGVVHTEQGFVVVLSATGIHVLSADSGAVLARWWCDPALEPDLAAVVGSDAQVRRVW